MTLQIHQHPNKLSFALGLVQEVLDVSYEHPGFWVIRTTKGEFHLGTANGCVGWNDLEGNAGETSATKVLPIVFAFADYLSTYTPTKKENHENK
jgi:hypothetical protein